MSTTGYASERHLNCTTVKGYGVDTAARDSECRAPFRVNTAASSHRGGHANMQYTPRPNQRTVTYPLYYTASRPICFALSYDSCLTDTNTIQKVGDSVTLQPSCKCRVHDKANGSHATRGSTPIVLYTKTDVGGTNWRQASVEVG